MGSLAIDLIIFPQSNFELIQILITEPIKKGCITKSVTTGSQQNNGSPLFDRLTAIIECFLRLDKIDIFRFAAAGDHRQISRLVQCHLKQFPHHLTTSQMRLFQIPTEYTENLLLWRKNRIQQKVRFNQLSRLNQIPMDRITS